MYTSIDKDSKLAKTIADVLGVTTEVLDEKDGLKNDAITLEDLSKSENFKDRIFMYDEKTWYTPTKGKKSHHELSKVFIIDNNDKKIDGADAFVMSTRVFGECGGVNISGGTFAKLEKAYQALEAYKKSSEEAGRNDGISPETYRTLALPHNIFSGLKTFDTTVQSFIKDTGDQIKSAQGPFGWFITSCSE